MMNAIGPPQSWATSFTGPTPNRSRTPARTTQIRAQHAVAVGGQRSDQFAPLPPVLRESVHQHHRRPLGGSGVGDVDRHTTTEIDELVVDTVEGGQSNHGLTT